MRETHKDILMFCLSLVPLILQLSGFTLAFLVSAILLARTVYKYDLPRKLLEKSELQELEASSTGLRLLKLLRWQTAIRLGLTVIGGALFISSLKLIVVNAIISGTSTQTLELQPLVQGIGGLLLALLVSVLSLHYLLSSYKRVKSLRRIIDKCTGADGRVAIYGGFLGFGGSFFVTIAVPFIVFFFTRTRVISEVEKKKKIYGLRG